MQVTTLYYRIVITICYRICTVFFFDNCTHVLPGPVHLSNHSVIAPISKCQLAENAYHLTTALTFSLLIVLSWKLIVLSKGVHNCPTCMPRKNKLKRVFSYQILRNATKQYTKFIQIIQTKSYENHRSSEVIWG